MPGKPASDDSVRAEVADLDVVEVHRAAVAAAAAFDLPVQLGHDPLHGRALRDRMAVRAVGRRDDVLARESRADAGRGRLLADRDVQEPGQLARPEAILHLLLEAADEEHLAEEAAQHFFGDASPPGPGSLFDGRHRAAIMLIRRCEPPTSGHRSRRASRPTGPRHSSPSRPKDRSRTLRRSSGRCSPAVSASELRLHVTRSDGGAGARQKPLPAARPEADLGDARTPRGRRRRARRLTRSGSRRRRRRSSRAGTRLSPSSRPTGAIFCASSSSIRATTFRAPRCSVRP